MVFLPLEQLLAEADVVSLHVALSAATERLIGAEQLALMKPTAILVNTARGGVLDQNALLEVLRGRRIAGGGVWMYSKPNPYHRDIP